MSWLDVQVQTAMPKECFVFFIDGVIFGKGRKECYQISFFFFGYAWLLGGWGGLILIPHSAKGFELARPD